MGESKKFCEDCAFYTRGNGPAWDRCSQFPVQEPRGAEYVRRDAPPSWGYCESARSDELRCGAGAKGFQRKQAVTT